MNPTTDNKNVKVIKPKRPINKNFIILVAVIVIILIITGVVLFFFNRKTTTTTNNQTSNNQSNAILDSYRSKLAELEANVNKNPNDPKAHRDYAVALYAVGDIENAKAQYLEEEKLNPKDPVLFNNLGNVYRDSGQYNEAVNAYQTSINLLPTQTNAYKNLASLYLFTLKKTDLAMQTYQNAIKNNPNSKEELTVLIASGYEQVGDIAKAIQYYQDVLKINANNATAKSALDRLKK